MRIVLDFNSDRVLINPDERYEKADVIYTKNDMRYQMSFLAKLLDEIFNRVGVKEQGLHRIVDFDIQLEKLDEDIHTAIGEW